MVTRQGGLYSPVVEWEAVWLDPRYRGTGRGRLAHEQARQWSRDQGYKFVVGFIRATYTPALHICKNLGFVYAYTIPDEQWADGSTGDTHGFVLDLRAATPERRYQKTLRHLDEVLAFLTEGAHAPPERYCRERSRHM
jgi:GNAT superfamily N-acetyltransferase